MNRYCITIYRDVYTTLIHSYTSFMHGYTLFVHHTYIVSKYLYNIDTLHIHAAILIEENIVGCTFF